MQESIESILYKLVQGVPGAYLQFKKTLLNLQGTYSAKQFVTFLSNQTSFLSIQMENMISRIASLFQHLTRVLNIISENLSANSEIIDKINHIIKASDKKNKSRVTQNIFDLVKKLAALRDTITLEIGEDIAELSKNKRDVIAMQLQNPEERIFSLFRKRFFIFFLMEKFTILKR
jgi:hypothetical protein